MSITMVVPCVLAIIENEKGQILIGKRKKEPFNGMWDIPGGKIEDGEQVEDAIKREVMEETGFNVEKIQLIDAFHNTGDGKMTELSGLAVCYKVEVSGSFVPDELEEFYWMPKEEFKNFLFTPFTNHFLINYFKLDN